MVVVNHHSDVFAVGEDHYGVPLLYLLSQLDLSFIAQEIENTYYSQDIGSRFHYRVELLLKIWIFQRYHKLTYRTVIPNLEKEDLHYLLTKDEMKRYCKKTFSLPSASTLHFFIIYRLGKEGVDKIIKMLGTELARRLKLDKSNADGDEGLVDSTPIPSSRYSPYFDFNPHYGIHMGKAHILSTAGYPLYMMFSNGNEDDGTYGLKLIEAAKQMNLKFKTCLCDGGYDNFLMYADISEKCQAQPIIRIRENGTVHDEANEKHLRKIANSKWKLGGDGKDTLPNILKFIYNLPVLKGKNPDKYKELVGMYLRNKNLENLEKINEQLNKRGRCEEMHSQLKDILKFNLRHCHKDTAEIYVELDFISAQCIHLAYLQNDSIKKSLAGYV